MKRAESFSRLLIFLAVAFAGGIPAYFWQKTPLVHARMPEAGGWSPSILRAEAGKPFTLRLISDDVVHGFAIGKIEMESVDVLPGKVTELTLTINQPGTYTFYCTRWCGSNHWRMRGTIEVTGEPQETQPPSPPLYMLLNLDLDQPHPAPTIPAQKPSARRAEQWVKPSLLSEFLSPDTYRSHSPYQVFEDLASFSLSEKQRWDAVAYIWRSNTTPEALINGSRLYRQNCAACHGETGRGDGVFAGKILPSFSNSESMGEKHAVHSIPPDFTDPKPMLGASPALLQGKVLRGGMGTGMPMFGSIFTEEQIWDVIAYLYSFQFEYQHKNE
jgi:mono/diheme cytochrome c family protein/plastocyanin